MVRMAYRFAALMAVSGLLLACGGRTPSYSGDGGPIVRPDGPYTNPDYATPDYGWPQPDHGWPPPPDYGWPPLDNGWPQPDQHHWPDYGWPPLDHGVPYPDHGWPPLDQGSPYLPDLTPVSFSAKVAGSLVTYNLKYCNLSKVTAQPAFYVGIYFNRPSPPTVSTKPDQQKKIPSLGASQCQTLGFTRMAPAGSKTLAWAFVDRDNAVGEANENNNKTSIIVQTPGPFDGGVPPQDAGGPPDIWWPPVDGGAPLLGDLTVTTFTATSTPDPFGYSINYKALVCNVGAATVSSPSIGLYYNSTQPPPGNIKPDRERKLSQLVPGQCSTVTFTRFGAAPGTYTSWIFADYGGWIKESNESNNRKSVKVQTGSSPTGPDLTITSFKTQLYGSSTISVSYRFTVCNQGTVASSNALLYVYYNRASAPTVGQPGDKFTTVYSLQPGACQQRSITRSGTPPGVYKSWGQIDPTNTIKESNENNNVSGPLTVYAGTTQPGADLSIKSFTAQSQGSSSYPYVRYTIEVCNNGTGVSGATIVTVYFDRASTPPATDLGDQYTTVYTLNPLQCSKRYVYRSSTPPGSYKSWARVDPANTIKETNETNNTAGPRSITVN